ncbi:sulfotransferase family 2 domain-containing protein [Litorimonas sp. WD9-15]|uniref:sulfotransferase family 2 domain-containing protein n=1 Tax=Litorimonas sp. WD9-15 TaxID=3418716 RepID=UPI003D069C47
MRAIHQIHINKTGGTTVGKALGLKFRHVDASDLVAELGEDGFDEAFIFSFVRNPWDRVVSHYHWRIKTNQTGLGDAPIPFKEWVKACFDRREPPYYDKPKMFRQQTDWLQSNSEKPVHPDVDFIGRFETLHKDIGRLSEILDISVSDIPHLKPSGRQRDYRPYYDAQTQAIIARAFATDIEVFGYTFD